MRTIDNMKRLAAIAAWIVVCAGASLAAEVAPDYDRDVRPILAARCLRCHGTDKSEAGLKLSSREHATTSLESGHAAIVPGDLSASELVRRVALPADDDERMPPDGPRLTTREVDLLRRWVAAGAVWPQHWAYRPLVEPPLPPTRSPATAAWRRTPVDAFITAQLEAANLTPSPEAERRVLLRRVTLDLTGLPPTSEEAAEFAADAAPDAYERAVDRLLASPRHGEHRARFWLDLVHFAESHGQDQDRPRDHAWRYRDYVIRAFNRDLPYDRFAAEQVAGDVLAPDDPWATIATGMLAAGPWDESSLRDIREDALDREIARYLDRDDIVTTVMTTFTSTTVQCARCHAHKFDPISQQDYYALQAVFAGIDKANRSIDLDPAVAKRRRELTARANQIDALAKQHDAALLALGPPAELAAWEARVKNKVRSWRVAEPLTVAAESKTKLEPQPDGSWLATGPAAERDTYRLQLAGASPRRVTGIRLELLADASLPQRGPGRAPNGNLHVSEVVAHVTSAGQPDGRRPVKLVRPQSDFDQPGWGVAMTLDGNPTTAWGIHPAIGQDHVAQWDLDPPVELAAGETLEIELRQLHGGSHLIGRFRLLTTDESPPPKLAAEKLPAELAPIIVLEPAKRTQQQQVALAAHFWRQRTADELAALPPQALVYCGTSDFAADGTFRPAAAPRDVRVLARGNILAPRETMSPGALNCLPELPTRWTLRADAREGERRLALARWLVDRRNGLAWRSAANRTWQQMFRRGLVDTPSDFGQLGSSPSHPELLDWLAVRLQTSGGSLHDLERLLATSAVYRQICDDRPVAAAVDQDNRLLWCMTRRRLTAEEVRDGILAQAGQLDLTLGGPSARQFVATPGPHVTPVVDYLAFPLAAPENRRRSIYRFVFRTLPDPFMESLDFPDASQWSPQRTESVTALQSLATMHDRQIARQSEQLARRVAAVAPTVEAQVTHLFQQTLGRPPSAIESQLVAKYARQHGLANTCRWLWNSNEFMFVD